MKINVKRCQERKSKDIERQPIRDIKALDGRMIMGNGVVKQERWAS